MSTVHVGRVAPAVALGKESQPSGGKKRRLDSSEREAHVRTESLLGNKRVMPMREPEHDEVKPLEEESLECAELMDEGPDTAPAKLRQLQRSRSVTISPRPGSAPPSAVIGEGIFEKLRSPLLQPLSSSAVSDIDNQVALRAKHEAGDVMAEEFSLDGPKERTSPPSFHTGPPTNAVVPVAIASTRTTSANLRSLSPPVDPLSPAPTMSRAAKSKLVTPASSPLASAQVQAPAMAVTALMEDDINALPSFTPCTTAVAQMRALCWCDEATILFPHDPELTRFMFERQLFYQPHPSYMSAPSQVELDAQMRSILFDWLMEVSQEFCLGRETLHLAFNYVDRFLALSNTGKPCTLEHSHDAHSVITRSDLQLLGVACLYVASKNEEIYPPSAAEFARTTDGGYSNKQIESMEWRILEVLGWYLQPQTPFAFVKLMLKLIAIRADTELPVGNDSERLPGAPSEKALEAVPLNTRAGTVALLLSVHHLTRIMEIIDLCALDINFLRFPPSLVAASAIFIVHHENDYICSSLFHVARHVPEQLWPCISIMIHFTGLNYRGLKQTSKPYFDMKIAPEEMYTRQMHNPMGLEFVQRMVPVIHTAPLSHTDVLLRVQAEAARFAPILTSIEDAQSALRTPCSARCTHDRPHKLVRAVTRPMARSLPPAAAAAFAATVSPGCNKNNQIDLTASSEDESSPGLSQSSRGSDATEKNASSDHSGDEALGKVFPMPLARNPKTSQSRTDTQCGGAQATKCSDSKATVSTASGYRSFTASSSEARSFSFISSCSQTSSLTSSSLASLTSQSLSSNGTGRLTVKILSDSQSHNPTGVVSFQTDSIDLDEAAAKSSRLGKAPAKAAAYKPGRAPAADGGSRPRTRSQMESTSQRQRRK